MASITKNLRTLVRHRKVRSAYYRWCSARLRRKLPVIDLPGGAFATATGKFNDFYGIYNQHPTEGEFSVYRQLLAGGGVFVDVGANMGLTTLLAAKTDLATRIIAFEPTHLYAEAWHRNIALNSVRHAALFQCAVGDSCGAMDFIINPNAPLHNRFNLGETRGRYAALPRDATHTESVSTMTIDAALQSCGVDQVKLLKIDVEGAEPGVLRGAVRLLGERAITNILLEFIPEFMEEMGESVDRFVDMLLGYGFECVAIASDGTLAPRLSREDLLQRRFQGLNIVAQLR